MSETRADFTPIYRELEGLCELAPDALLPEDRLYGAPEKNGPRLSTAQVQGGNA